MAWEHLDHRRIHLLHSARRPFERAGLADVDSPRTFQGSPICVEDLWAFLYGHQHQYCGVEQVLLAHLSSHSAGPTTLPAAPVNGLRLQRLGRWRRMHRYDTV